ncbi:hypothetical protein Y032_0132g1699 [Ancylostoma ceylanicum]|uniref:Uncharacterized protein n=1 Tax=Ancylostoma ceylanicum TaxID=53326 RepID=A0A016T6R1_9BILA|nr:hypothetical protein Y032_0132g1699 [Ancylostoma ceylanicum]
MKLLNSGCEPIPDREGGCGMAATPARDIETLDAGRAPTGTDPGTHVSFLVEFTVDVATKRSAPLRRIAWARLSSCCLSWLCSRHGF